MLNSYKQLGADYALGYKDCPALNEQSMSLASNSDPKQSGSSEWIRDSERIRERLAEESPWKIPIEYILKKASRYRWVVPMQHDNQ
jgi:hypothetical protein